MNSSSEVIKSANTIKSNRDTIQVSRSSSPNNPALINVSSMKIN